MTHLLCGVTVVIQWLRLPLGALPVFETYNCRDGERALAG